MDRTRAITMGYVNRLEDRGIRGVLILRLAYGYSDKKTAQVLGLREATVEKIGKKGALKVQEMMYNDMKKRGMLINAV